MRVVKNKATGSKHTYFGDERPREYVNKKTGAVHTFFEGKRKPRVQRAPGYYSKAAKLARSAAYKDRVAKRVAHRLFLKEIKARRKALKPIKPKRKYTRKMFLDLIKL